MDRAKKGRPRGSSRPGRDLERLVALLEATLAGPGVSITSPERLRDRDTGGWREVDVALRMKGGSADLLVIWECRDRSRPQDDTWIEQLAGKGKSVRADKVVAVSRSGFAEPVKKKAAACDIEVRTLDDLTPDAVREAIKIRGLLWDRSKTDIVSCEVLFAVESEALAQELRQHLSGGKHRVMDRDFVWASNGQACSALDIWNRAIAEADPAFDLHEAVKVPEDGSRVRRRLKMNIAPPGDGKDGALLSLPTGQAAVIQLSVEAEMWCERTELRPTSAHSYRSPGRVLVDTLEYAVDATDDGGGREVIAFHRAIETGRVGVSRRSLEGKPLVQGRLAVVDPAETTAPATDPSIEGSLGTQATR